MGIGITEKNHKTRRIITSFLTVQQNCLTQLVYSTYSSFVPICKVIAISSDQKFYF